MTFTLISTVYACGIAKPGHGSLTPVAVGFSLVACAGAGAKYTGETLMPHREGTSRWKQRRTLLNNPLRSDLRGSQACDGRVVADHWH